MAYERINFQNYPSTATPLDETTLNKMDSELKYLDDNTIESDIWNASTSYEVGAFVIYENKLYRALVQNTNVAPNTSSVTWEQTNLTQTLGAHFDEIVEQNKKIAKHKEIDNVSIDTTGHQVIANLMYWASIPYPDGMNKNNVENIKILSSSGTGFFFGFVLHDASIYVYFTGQTSSGIAKFRFTYY